MLHLGHVLPCVTLTICEMSTPPLLQLWAFTFLDVQMPVADLSQGVGRLTCIAMILLILAPPHPLRVVAQQSFTLIEFYDHHFVLRLF